jgi:hypothetical protein
MRNLGVTPVHVPTNAIGVVKRVNAGWRPDSSTRIERVPNRNHRDLRSRVPVHYASPATRKIGGGKEQQASALGSSGKGIGDDRIGKVFSCEIGWAVGACSRPDSMVRLRRWHECGGSERIERQPHENCSAQRHPARRSKFAVFRLPRWQREPGYRVGSQWRGGWKSHRR